METPKCLWNINLSSPLIFGNLKIRMGNTKIYSGFFHTYVVTQIQLTYFHIKTNFLLKKEKKCNLCLFQCVLTPKVSWEVLSSNHLHCSLTQQWLHLKCQKVRPHLEIASGCYSHKVQSNLDLFTFNHLFQFPFLRKKFSYASVHF